MFWLANAEGGMIEVSTFPLCNMLGARTLANKSEQNDTARNDALIFMKFTSVAIRGLIRDWVFMNCLDARATSR